MRVVETFMVINVGTMMWNSTTSIG